MRRGFAVLFLGICVAVGITACGGKSTSSSTPAINVSSKATYERQMQILGQQLNSVMDGVAGADSSQTSSGAALPAKIEAQNLQIAQNGLRSTAVKLARIVPPAKVKAAHELLLKGLREDAAELTVVIAKLKKGADPLAVLPTVLQLRGLKDMRAASIAIEKAGYDILGTGTGTSSGG
jgi:hypothetical protein